MLCRPAWHFYFRHSVNVQNNIVANMRSLYQLRGSLESHPHILGAPGALVLSPLYKMFKKELVNI
jgi:hypothetical protein